MTAIGERPDALVVAGLDIPRMRLLAVLAPAVFVAGLIVLTVVLADDVPLPLLIGIGMLSVTAGAALFSGFVFHIIERDEARLLERNEHLAALQGAATAIAGEYQLDRLLQRFVEQSKTIIGARYAALSVLRPDGSIESFITSGITDEERARIGPPPVGRGLLGVIIQEDRALRVDDMAADPRSIGFPPHHPPMTTLLGVPLMSRGEAIGRLYLTDKLDGTRFTAADEETVRAFAAHAAVAIETSRLQDQSRLLAVHRERERIGMDLHDGIIQQIYAVGLSLEVVADDVARDAAAARRGLDDVIERLGDVIADIRRYIFELRPARLSFDLSEALHDLAREFTERTGLRVSTDIAPALPDLDAEQRAAIFHVAQEALANARKHAGSATLSLALALTPTAVALTVRDTGAGFDTAAGRGEDHHGLRNMESRAHAAGGTLLVESAPGKGTAVTLQVPLRREETSP